MNDFIILNLRALVLSKSGRGKMPLNIFKDQKTILKTTRTIMKVLDLDLIS